MFLGKPIFNSQSDLIGRWAYRYRAKQGSLRLTLRVLALVAISISIGASTQARADGSSGGCICTTDWDCKVTCGGYGDPDAPADLETQTQIEAGIERQAQIEADRAPSFEAYLDRLDAERRWLRIDGGIGDLDCEAEPIVFSSQCWRPRDVGDE